MSIRPIETTYGNRRYRSRVEARWAIFFDCAGIAFAYEAEGFALRSGAYVKDDLQEVVFSPGHPDGCMCLDCEVPF